MLFEISCCRRKTQQNKKNKKKTKKTKKMNPQQEPLKSKTTPSWAKKED
jgi:hypothetical protein